MRTLVTTLALLLAFVVGASIAWSAEGPDRPDAEGPAKKAEAKGKVSFQAEITYDGKTAKYAIPLAAAQRLAGIQKQMERAKGEAAPKDFACRITLNADSQEFADPVAAAAACQRCAAAMANSRKAGIDPASLTIPAEGEFAAGPMGEVGRPLPRREKGQAGEGFVPPGANTPPQGGFGGFGGVNPNGPPGAQGGIRVGGEGGNPLGNLPPQLQQIVQLRLRQYVAETGNYPNPEVIQRVIRQTIEQAKAGGFRPGGEGPRGPMPGKEGKN